MLLCKMSWLFIATSQEDLIPMDILAIYTYSSHCVRKSLFSIGAWEWDVTATRFFLLERIGNTGSQFTHQGTWGKKIKMHPGDKNGIFFDWGRFCNCLVGRANASRQSIVHIWEVDYFILPHVNDQHTKLKRITSCIPCTYYSCPTTFVHGSWSLATPKLFRSIQA
jgi:hypothetical protein